MSSSAAVVGHVGHEPPPLTGKSTPDGQPTAQGAAQGGSAARFWAKVDREGPVPPHVPEIGPCWVWTGSHHTEGYGRFWYGTKRNGGRFRQVYAHRFSYELNVGPIPADKPLVLHRCDNPPCVNPAHLFPGTDEENFHDMRAKGRQRGGSIKQAWLTVNGETLAFCEWSRRIGCGQNTIRDRILRGWDPARAVSTPPIQTGRWGRR